MSPGSAGFPPPLPPARPGGLASGPRPTRFPAGADPSSTAARRAETRNGRRAEASGSTMMFVEVVRGFMVVLGTAAGFWVARDLGVPAGAQGVGGVLGCLAGYVSGGLLGRLLERALGFVEHRVDRLPPAAVVAGALGALGGALAGLTVAVPLVLLVHGPVAIVVGGLVIWIGAWAGFRIVGRQSAALFELLGL